MERSGVDLARALRTARRLRAAVRGPRRGGDGGGRRPPPRLRFPCGHVESRRAVNRRLRSTERAVWIACRRCNVVALALARPGA
jgi:hypothetical protein